jgi:hypothetical protein
LEPTPNGSDPIPDYARWSVYAWNIVSPLLALFVVYVWGIRPWRRAGHITTDGILLIAFFLMCFQDPLPNYFQYNFSYNSYAVNLGNWVGEVPGAILPRAHLYPEPLLFIAPSYIWGYMLPAAFSCLLMRRCRRRWPRIGNVGLFSIVFVVWFLVDFIAEPLVFMRLSQLWTHSGAIRSLSLHAGSRYQFPIYEPILIGVMYTGFAALRWFVDDKGRTVAERGIDEVRATVRQKTTLRILATTACASTIIFLTYNLPWQWFATHADAFPKDLPSYMVNGICGVGTPYPCPAADTPIFRPGSKPPILPPSNQ